MGTEEISRFGNFFRPDQTAQCAERFHARWIPVAAVDAGLHGRRQGKAGRDGVDADARGAEFGGQDFGQAVDGGLGRGIGRQGQGRRQ